MNAAFVVLGDRYMKFWGELVGHGLRLDVVESVCATTGLVERKDGFALYKAGVRGIKFWWNQP